MPIRPDGKARNGTPYVSPRGEIDEPSFKKLTRTDQYYVHYYGGRISGLIHDHRRIGEAVTYAGTAELVEKNGGLWSLIGGRKLGHHTIRLAIHATLRWMVHRGELAKTSTREGRVLIGENADA